MSSLEIGRPSVLSHRACKVLMAIHSSYEWTASLRVSKSERSIIMRSIFPFVLIYAHPCFRATSHIAFVFEASSLDVYIFWRNPIYNFI